MFNASGVHSSKATIGDYPRPKFNGKPPRNSFVEFMAETTDIPLPKGYGSLTRSMDPKRCRTVDLKKFTHIACFLPDSERVEEYKKIGLKVVHLPIVDFSVPKLNDLIKAVNEIVEILKNPNNKVIGHCTAGWGRTGTVLVPVYAKINNISVYEEALLQFRQFVPQAVERPEQHQIAAQCVQYFANEVAQNDKLKHKYQKCIKHINSLKHKMDHCASGARGRQRHNSLALQVAIHEERKKEIESKLNKNTFSQTV